MFERLLPPPSQSSNKELKEFSLGGTLQLTWPVAENPNPTMASEPQGSGVPLLEALTKALERKG